MLGVSIGVNLRKILRVTTSKGKGMGTVQREEGAPPILPQRSGVLPRETFEASDIMLS